MTTERYKNNPFVSGMVVNVKKRQVRLSTLGRDNNILINQDTGEVSGTHLTTYKRVDTEQFVKLFTANIAMTFDLTAAGIKAFSVLLWAVQNTAPGKDEVDLDQLTLDEFMKAHLDQKLTQKLSLPTFRRGIAELENAKIVAKTLRKGRYFINPNFVFNGDRVAFTTVIEHNSGGPKRDPHTVDMLTGTTDADMLES